MARSRKKGDRDHRQINFGIFRLFAGFVQTRIFCSPAITASSDRGGRLITGLYKMQYSRVHARVPDSRRTNPKRASGPDPSDPGKRRIR